MAPKKKARFDPPPALPPVVWQVLLPDRSEWKTFQSATATTIESNWQTYKSADGGDDDSDTFKFARGAIMPTEMGFGAAAATYNFKKMIVVDGDNSHPLRRLTPAMWEWKDDNGLFVAFYDDDNNVIETAWRRLSCVDKPDSFSTTNLSFNTSYGSTYVFTFSPPDPKTGLVLGTQKNEDSGTVRELKRSTPAEALKVVDAKSGFGVSGMKMPDVKVSSDDKKADEDKKEDDAKKTSGGDNDDDDDNKATAAVPQGVETIPANLFDFPPEWEPGQTADPQLFVVSPKSAEYTSILKDFKKTMFGTPKIQKVERIQHRTLWKFYALMRFRVAKRNGGDASERWLFHGARARENMDAITNFGFDMRVARDGLAGMGIYFATNASYSNAGYVFSHPDGTKEMYVCRVACGSSTEGKHGMKRPPQKSSKKGCDEAYDSVTRGTPPTMYVVFDNMQAIPAYVITYKP